MSQAPGSEAEFLRVAEVAVALHVSERLVRDRLADQTIPSIRLGRAVLIPRSWLDGLLESAQLRAPKAA